MRTRLLFLGTTLAGCSQPPTKVIVRDGDTIVTVESSDCCCEPDPCCDSDDGGDGGGSGDPPPPDDTGVVVEPEDCDDMFMPSALEPTLTEECEGTAVVREITYEPVVEWAWAPTPEQRYFNQVMMAPTVGNLTDDNGDGVIDANDTPDVAFIAYGENLYQAGEAGALVILDGATGAEHFISDLFLSAQSSEKDYAAATSGVALGDLDADGIPEACFATAKGHFVCFHADGTLALDVAKASTIPFAAHVAGYPAIGDLDGDGQAEVVVGSFGWYTMGMNAIQGLGGVGARMSNGREVAAISVLSDVMGDSNLEIVAGNTVYDHLGATLWEDTSAKDGLSAVADLDLDGTPEIITVAIGVVNVYSNTGSLLQSFSLDYCPTTSGCGAPTIADFNGDGMPDIGVAGDQRYAVYTDPGSGFTELWSNPTNDGSGATSASIFDFEDDGINEVVYADEDQLYIWRGTDGSNLLSGSTFDATQHANGTTYEMPVVADVDNDGESEIILASNTFHDSTGWSGVRALGSGSGDAWASSRPVWNQHTYHITNIEDDLSVPAVEDQNWLEYNNFRVADSSSPAVLDTDLPDLQIQEGYEICFDCDAGEATIYIRVANAGQGDAESTELLFESDGVELARVEVEALAAGDFRVVGPVTVPTSAWSGRMDVLIDPDEAIEECDEDNNLSSAMGQTWANDCE